MTELNLKSNRSISELRSHARKLHELTRLFINAHHDFAPLSHMYNVRIQSMLKTSDFRTQSDNLLDYVAEIDDVINRISTTRSEDSAAFFTERAQRLIYALYLCLNNSENDQIIVSGTPRLSKSKQNLESYQKQIQYYRKQEIPLTNQIEELQKRALRAENIELNEIQTSLFALQQRVQQIQRKKSRLEDIIRKYNKDKQTQRNFNI